MAERHVDHLLIGGGMASVNCARWLRESGADGSILIVSREPDPPYHRPPCSKGYLQGKESRAEALFRPPEWYDEQEVQVLTRTSVMKLDPSARIARLSNREEVSFSQALVATGANVRRLNLDGAQLAGLHYLRTLGNSDTIREDAAGKRVVLVGGSYIASELAATLTELGSPCTIVMLEPVLLSNGFGEQAGRYFQTVLEDHGVEVIGDEEVERFEGTGDRVTKVVTKSGRELECDAVVLGTGAVPDVMLARSAGLELGDSGGVRCDAHLQTSVSGIFAAGDMAQYDSVIHGGRSIRIEHEDVAISQGKTAALNMLDRRQPHDTVPYFFSDLSDWASLEYVGPAFDWDEEIVRGSLDEGKFTVFYLHGGRLAGALSVGTSDDLDHARRMIASGADVGGARGRLGDLSSELSQIAPAQG